MPTTRPTFTKQQSAKSTRKVNPANKERKFSNPYASWTCGEWKFKLLKSWQANQHKEHARWFMGIKSPHTYGDYEYGDTYVCDVWPSLQNFLGMTGLVIDETVWSTPGEFLAWAFDEE